MVLWNSCLAFVLRCVQTCLNFLGSNYSFLFSERNMLERVVVFG
jgi:hypothetical protein